MLEKILQIPYLRSIDPIWISLGPLLTFNILLLSTLAFFGITYKMRPKHEDLDLKEHSRLLSPFLKDYWYWLTAPFVKLMVKLHITPNVLTVWGFVICCVSAYFFHKGMIGAGGWFMIFGATFDLFDGRVARLTGRASQSGAFFDSVMDRFCEGVVFLGLASFYRSSWVLYFVVMALVGSMMVSYTRARGEGVGVDVKKGIMQRAERIVYLGVGSIFSPIFAYFISFVVPTPIDFMTIGAILLIAIFTNLGALYRIRYVIRKLDPRPRESNTFLARLIHRWNNLGS
jgi:phosphatidylglycerophosphate synthase